MANKRIAEELELYVDFAEKVLDGYDWDFSEKRELYNAVQKVRARINDPCVNIAVVGEFSSGKSSLINALLGLELLDMDELPDTTLVPAVLEYGRTAALKIEGTDGVTRIVGESLENIKRDLRNYSLPDFNPKDYPTEEGFIKALTKAREEARRKCADISRFIITLPSPFLKTGVRLIDTPGLSSSYERGARMAEESMRSADLSILVGNATKGVMLQDIQSRFSSILRKRVVHCVAVFTHFDQTTRRDRLSDYLKVTVPAAFDLTPEQLPVFMSVPPTILSEAKGERFGKEHKEMLDLTRNTIDSIVRHARERKEKAIFNSTVALTEELYGFLEGKMTDQKKRCETRLAKLNKSKEFPLASKVAELGKIQETFLHAAKAEKQAELKRFVEAKIEALKKEEGRMANGQGNFNDLNTYIEKHLPEHLKSTGRVMSIKFREETSGFMIPVIKCLKEFEKRMESLFDDLGIEPVKLSLRLPKADNYEVATDELSGVLTLGKAEKDRQDAGIGMAIVGGIIGSIVTFGIGTAFGAAIGAWLGTGGKVSGIDAAKKRVVPEIHKAIDTEFGKHRNRLMHRFLASANKMIGDYTNLLDSYQENYRNKLNELILEEKNQQRKIRQEIEQIVNDLVLIKRSKVNLNSLWKMK